MLPARSSFLQGLEPVVARAEDLGGSIAALDVAPRDSRASTVLRAADAEVRLEEWSAFLEDCRALQLELDHVGGRDAA